MLILQQRHVCVRSVCDVSRPARCVLLKLSTPLTSREDIGSITQTRPAADDLISLDFDASSLSDLLRAMCARTLLKLGVI